MKKNVVKCVGVLGVFIAFTLSVNAQTSSQHKQNAATVVVATPPLGFNSFDSYLDHLSEDKANQLIDVMAKKYKPFGYNYFVIDAGWYDNATFLPGTSYAIKRNGLALDEYGLPESSKDFFPNGIKALADKAHSKGLKFGVWIIRGIPREAVKKNLPIKGTQYRARDIADTTNICAWDTKNYGVDMSKPGAQEYYNALIDKLASFGVDFIKVDDMVPHPKEVVAIEKAIQNGGHKMIYSLSPGDLYLMQHMPYFKKANMLRITSDIWDNQLSIDRSFMSWEKFAGSESANFWPDLDMIPFGRLRVIIPESMEGEKDKARQSRFTNDQMKTFITQRALAASPLFIGGDLLTMDDYSYSLLTNKDMLACNQNGVMGHLNYRKGSIEVWVATNKDTPGKGWIGIFNRSNAVKHPSLTKSNLGFKEIKKSYDIIENPRSFKVKSIWENKEFVIEGNQKFSIPAHGVVFLKFEELQ